MPKFGGKKALTKQTHTPDYSTLNPTSSVDDPTKINLEITDLMDKNIISICSPHVNPIKTRRITSSKSNLVKTKTRMNTIKMRLGKIMNKLYNLEPVTEAEKPVKIDLDVELYQMEDI